MRQRPDTRHQLVAGVWALAHLVIGSLSTTVYSHRLITHNATKKVSLPVHLFFCVFGQILSVQGSVRRWSSNHVLHHGVDRHGKKEIDPYSATWFPDAVRNFLWSHTLAKVCDHKKLRTASGNQVALYGSISFFPWRSTP